MDYGLVQFWMPSPIKRFWFCKKYKLEIKTVVKPANENDKFSVDTEPHTGPGVLIVQNFKWVICIGEFINKTIKYLEENNLGIKNKFQTKDWGYQDRVWDAPIPIAYDENNEVVKIPERIYLLIFQILKT